MKCDEFGEIDIFVIQKFIAWRKAETSAFLKRPNYLQEPGRYFVGIGFVAAGPHLHSVIVTPTLPAASATPFTNGAN